MSKHNYQVTMTIKNDGAKDEDRDKDEDEDEYKVRLRTQW